MQITRQADYAVRAVLHLAELKKNGGRAPTSKIASDEHIPPSFLAKIVSQLSVAGVVQTSRGARGGVSLSREPSEITLLEVVEAIDGPITINECVNDPNACPFGERCKVHTIWCNVQSEMINKLSGTTFAELVTQ